MSKFCLITRIMQDYFKNYTSLNLDLKLFSVQSRKAWYLEYREHYLLSNIFWLLKNNWYPIDILKEHWVKSAWTLFKPINSSLSGALKNISILSNRVVGDHAVAFQNPVILQFTIIVLLIFALYNSHSTDRIIAWANIGHFVGSVFGSTLTNDVGRMPFFSSVRRTCKRLIRCWSNVLSQTSTA